MALNEFDTLRRVVVKHARDAFISDEFIAAHWQRLHFTAKPDLRRAIDEYDAFLDVLRSAGAAVDLLPADSETTLDSIYARDASIMSPGGMILGRMGKPARDAEPWAQARAFGRFSPPLPVAGQIVPPGRLEGGDVIWLDDRALAVGCGYRTNAEGIRQLRALLDPHIAVVQVPLPHWRGPEDVMHLMSLISPVDEDLAVVYSPLLPVPFREWLLERGMRLIDVPDAEFVTMGTNVLALGPRRCLMLAGNPRTSAALEAAGAEVVHYEGRHVSVMGAGGPTCLTRPVERVARP